MGRATADAPDRSTALATGSFTASGQNGAWVTLAGPFHFAAWAGAGGQVGGKVQVQQSFDGGVTALPASKPDGSANEWDAPVALTATALPERDVLYRLRCTALTSGSLNWRISQ